MAKYTRPLVQVPYIAVIKLLYKSNITAIQALKKNFFFLKVWFDLAKTREGERGRSRLEQQIDSGALKATARIKDPSGPSYNVRLNL